MRYKRIHVLWRNKIGGVEKLNLKATEADSFAKTIYVRSTRYKYFDYLFFLLCCIKYRFLNASDEGLAIILWSQSPLLLILSLPLSFRRRVYVHFGQPVTSSEIKNIERTYRKVFLFVKDLKIFCISDKVLSCLKHSMLLRSITDCFDLINKTLTFSPVGEKVISTANRFVYVGRVEPLKNIHLLRNVLDDMPSPKIGILGPIEDEAYFQSLRDTFIVDYYLPSGQPFSVLSNAGYNTLFFFPSNDEGFGLVMLEALESGFSVLTWWDGPIPQMARSECRVKGQIGFLSLNSDCSIYERFQSYFNSMISSSLQ